MSTENVYGIRHFAFIVGSTNKIYMSQSLNPSIGSILYTGVAIDYTNNSIVEATVSDQVAEHGEWVSKLSDDVSNSGGHTSGQVRHVQFVLYIITRGYIYISLFLFQPRFR